MMHYSRLPADTGISVGWGWDFSQQRTWPRMPWDGDNWVIGNNIHHVMTRLGDGGMIYTLGPQGNKPWRNCAGCDKSYPSEPEPPLHIKPMSRIERNYLHHNGPASSTGGGFKAKALYSDSGSTNWRVSQNVIEDNAGPNFVWMSGCRDGTINNSWSDNAYSCRVTHGKSLGPHGRVSECCDSACPGWRNNASKCTLLRTVNYTGSVMPASAREVAAAAGPRPRPRLDGVR